MIMRKVFSALLICAIFLSVFTVFIQIPLAQAATTLGNNTSISSTMALSANTIYYIGPFTAASTGYISQINAAVWGAGSIIMALYSDNAGSPNTLLATTQAVMSTNSSAINTYQGIYTQVTSGSTYWFAALSNNTPVIGLAASGSWALKYQSSTYPTFAGTASTSSGSTYTLPVAYAVVLSDPFTVSNIAASTVKVGLSPTFTALWSTNQTLSHFIVETNRTGTPVNETAQAFTTNYSTYTPSWQLTNIGNLQWRIFANTTLGLWANTGVQVNAVTYTDFTISGPYIEDNGAVANQVVYGTVYFTNGMSQVFTLNGTSGTAQSYAINPAYTPLSVTWQAIANYSYTRTYYLSGTTSANITVFVPNPASTPQIYQFTISDFYGVSNPYIASSLTVGGNLTSQTYIIERKPLTVGTVSLILEQWHSYTLQIQSDQGTYSVEFSAEGSFLTNINIPAGAFPTSPVSYPVAQATRTNSTAITITYSDTSENTTTLEISITHKNGAITITDYLYDTPSNIQTIVWPSADPTTTYTIYVTAISGGQTYLYAFVAAAAAPSNPFENMLDWLGPNILTLPHVTVGWPEGVEPSQLFASIIIVAALCIGSFRSAGISCLISALIGGLMIYMGWWQSAIPIWSLSLVLAAIIIYDEYRQSNGGYMAT